MDKKGIAGSIKLIMGVVVALLIIAVVANVFVKKVAVTGKGFGVCTSTDTPDYKCFDLTSSEESNFDGCPLGYEHVMSIGCPNNQNCCRPVDDPAVGPGSDSKHSLVKEYEPTIFINIYDLETNPKDLQFNSENVDITKETIVNGLTLNTLAEDDRKVKVVVEVEGCQECDLSKSYITWHLRAPSGTDVLSDVALRMYVSDVNQKKINKIEQLPIPRNESQRMEYFNTDHLGKRGNADTIKYENKPEEHFWLDRSLFLVFPASYNEEILSLEVTAHIAYKTEVTLEGKKRNKRDYTATFSEKLHFNVKPAIRYGGLSQQWTKNKRLTVVCDREVNCEEIYYEIVPRNEDGRPAFQCGLSPINKESADTMLEHPTASARYLTELAKYCIVDSIDSLPVECDLDGFKACNDRLEELEDPVYSQAFDELMAAVSTSEVSRRVHEFAAIFQQHESRTAGLSCQPSLSPIDGLSTEEKPNLFKLEDYDRDHQFGFDKDLQRGSFDLNQLFMSEQFFCLYGKDVHDHIYVADKEPREIKIDLTPPETWIDFNPVTLMLTFNCIDSQSKCTEDYSTAHVDKLSNFLPALFNGNPQNAYIWCPPYERGHRYKTQPAPRVPYHDNAIRVMCLRVEDNAGNVAVSMRTLYNTWTLLAVAYAKYKDQEPGVDYGEAWEQDYDTTNSYYYG
ncbi:MAG: hypothetical protein OXR66_06035 [Candidatus Woesearchaeota archaeon]|nr:hypothetical protein [Candidatus Woesearchaeota archaeon]